ncbi:MAG: glycoside hydrolase family 92 protein [Flavobacteriales bacterium]|nr:glycoside hydrolase family 92 protein [Flavobacteriales bacterium]MDW8410441.1 glycoside hydrolase family 92 protein [Flavobacteriales bacterium]
MKGAFTFSPHVHQLVVRVGLSAVCVENARLNLQTEFPHNDFDRVVGQAEAIWNQKLSKFEVRRGTPKSARFF